MTDTTNNVEEIDGSELSTDKDEVDIDTIEDVEELRGFAKREREAKLRAVQHMLDQKAKRKTVEAVVAQPIVEDTEVSTEEKTLELIREEAKKAVQQEHKEARLTEYSAGSTDWMKNESWAAEINGSDKLYSEFATELKRLSGAKEVHSQTDFRNLMRLAAVNVTGKADALLQESADAEIATDKQQSGGYRPSQASVPAQSYEQFSPIEQQMIQDANILRAKVGKPPVKVIGGKIIKD